MIRFLIWDVDGALFDAYPAIARAFQEALNDMGTDASCKKKTGQRIARLEEQHMENLQSRLTQSLLHRGAALVGFADLSEIPAEARHGLRFGVSIAARLNPVIVAGIRNGPNVEYYAEYIRVNDLLASLGEAAAGILRADGYRALTLAPTVTHVTSADFATPLPHKTVATRAGLGWIGKSALLVTQSHGSAVRLTTVLTDAEFETGAPIEKSHCGDCAACVDACPAAAFTGEHWSPGVAREALVDTAACINRTAEYAPGIGSDPSNAICGICIAACPWTRSYVRLASKRVEPDA